MKSIQEIVKELGDKIVNNGSFFLEYSEIGYVESVKLHLYDNDMVIKVNLWDSDNEQRRYIEEINEYEDFEIFLKRKTNECLSMFLELKQILIEKD